ncbi:MAG: hypothetical protein KGJ13_08870 [Patescibacteria group bacterium]|nr:hypothetical protein [Patescibacteria group bacterium]
MKTATKPDRGAFLRQYWAEVHAGKRVRKPRNGTLLTRLAPKQHLQAGAMTATTLEPDDLIIRLRDRELEIIAGGQRMKVQLPKSLAT